MNIQLKDVDNVVFNGIDISAVKFNNVLVWQKWETLEYTGGVPVTVTANGEPLLDYLISGNMQQSGTPSPQTVIFPEETGERTGNLAQSVEQGGITNVGEKTAASNRIRVKADVSPNTTYTFASNKPISIISGFTGETFAHSIISPAGFPTQSTFTTGEDDTVVYVTLRNEDNTTIRPADLSGAMLNLGSTALPYEPYGYKIPFSSGGENLFDYSAVTLGKYINANGEEVDSTSSADTSKLNHTDYISVISGEPYIYNYVDGVTVTNTIALCWFDAQKQIISRNTLNVRTNNYSLSATAPNNAKYCIINFTGYPVPVSCLTFNLGSTAKPYTPYHRTSTPIYLGEVPTTRRIKKFVLTGADGGAWSYNGSIKNGNAFFNPNVFTGYKPNVSEGYCTHYPLATSISDTVGVFFGGNINFITAFSEDIDTPEKWRNYLAAQYANGTPVTVWYVLATEQTGILNEPLRKIGDYADSISMEQAQVQIPIISGVNVVDIDTTLKPSSIYLKYKGKS